ncbi:MAG: S41 family peptidase [Gemmatimonas sp.]
MLQPARRFIHTDTLGPLLRLLVGGGALALASACSSMFKLTPEEGAGAAAKPTAAKPADKPEAKVEKPKTEKPPKVEAPKVEKPPKVETPKVEKPKVEKPVAVEKKPETKGAEKPPQKVVEKPVPAPKPAKEPAAPKPDKSAKPLAVAPPPPEVRRSEPVVEPMALEPTPAGSDSAGVERLKYAAVLWDAVRLFHPTVAANSAQWDNETVRRLTEVRTAHGSEYGQVMQQWISRLNDPVTRLVDNGFGDFATGVPSGMPITSQTQIVVTGAKKTREVDTTVVLSLAISQPTSDTVAWSSLLSAIRTAGNASQLVIDLRTNRSTRGVANFEQQGSVRDLQLQVANALSTLTVAGPSVRRRVYEGWPDERNVGLLSSTNAAWRVSEPLVIVHGESQVHSRRLVFVASKNTEMPPALLALVSSRQATLVTDAPLSDHLLVPTRRIALGEQLSAFIRVGELLNADGSIGIVPDTMVAPSSLPDSAPVIRTAIQIARGILSPHARIAVHEPPTSSATIASNAWTTAHYPIMGARLLSVFKMWGTLRAFHAYSELRDESVDDALTRFIPRAEAATDAYSFSSVMLDYASTTNDAQSELTSPTIVQHLGAAAAPFATRWIEGRAIVTQIAPDDAGRASGLAPGDEITAADGYPMPAYVSEHRKYGPASNEWTALRNTMSLVPRGVPGDAVFKVRDANNRERSVTIPRSGTYFRRFTENDRTSTSVFRSFTGGIGYLDLDRATSAQVDSAFQMLGPTRALIVDARGRGTPTPSGAMSAAMNNVIRRLAAVPNAVVDKQTVRVASEPCAPADLRVPSTACLVERRQFDDILAADTVNRYKGRVVVVIDERTQGAMEQFALGIEGSANPVFVGTPSAGAAGALTSVKLPGIITLTFSENDLRHADGRQLQRVGLTPQVEATPTVKGVRSGTDDVLARAQEWLLQQLDSAAQKRKK